MTPPAPDSSPLRPLVQLVEIDPAPPPDDPPGWLSARERQIFAGLRIDKRRGDWLAGRRAAKAVLAAALAEAGPAGGGARPGTSPAGTAAGPLRALLPGRRPPSQPPDAGAARLEILADPDGAPAAWLDGRRLEVGGRPPGLSLTHSGALAAALVTPPGVRCGCDLEQLQPRSDALVADHFTAAEIARIRTAPTAAAATLATNLAWSAKEAALKLLRTGLRRDTRSVEVAWSEAADRDGAESRIASRPTEPPWRPLCVTDLEAPERKPLTGWWLPLPGAVLTLVTDPPTPAPRLRP